MATLFRSDGWVKTAQGPAVAGAQVYVCAPQPANVATAPPSPLLAIFADINGLIPITQPIITDGFGHYDFYAPASLFTLVVALGGAIQQVYIDQNLGLGNVGPGNPYVAGTNITIIGNVISAVIPPQVTVDLQTNSVDNTLQTKLNLKNGTNISITSDGAGGVTISNSQTATPVASAVRWSVPKFQSLSSTWDEAPTLPWSTIAGALGGSSSESFVQPTASVAGYNKIVNDATVTHNCWFAGSSKSSFIGNIKTFKVNAAFFSTTNVRDWVGLSDDTNPGAGNLEANNPNRNIIGFRFSSSADGTTWQAYCSTSNVAFTAQSTGVTVDTTGALHTFEFRTTQGTPGTVTFYIDGVQVAQIATNVPAATTGLTTLVYSESLATTTGTPAVGCNMFQEVNFQ